MTACYTKETPSSLPTVQLATYLAVGHFNDGSKTILSVLENLGVEPGVHSSKACKKIDKKREEKRPDSALAAKELTGKLDMQKRDTMKLRKLKRDPSMRLVLSRWKQELSLWFDTEIKL